MWRSARPSSLVVIDPDRRSGCRARLRSVATQLPVVGCWSFVVIAFLLAPLIPRAEAATAQVIEAKAEVARIVSVGGAVTEILFALGAGDRIVGIDTTSRWPPQVDTLPKVGYQRNLAAEGIVALGPTLLIGTEAAGPPSVLTQVRNTGISVIQVPEPRSPKAIVQRIHDIASILGRQEQGRLIAHDLAAQIEGLGERIARIQERPRTLFILSAGRGAPLASGTGTAADTMIRMAGGINVVDSYEGYKPVNPETVMAMEPDVLLLTNRTLDLVGGLPGLKRLPGLGDLAAVQGGRVVAMDGLYLLGFGPRTGAALADLADNLHGADRP